MRKPKSSKGKIFLLAIFAFIAVRWFFFRAPSEQQMIAEFHAHKAKFEQLRLMLVQDKNLKALGVDWANAKYKRMPDGVEAPALPLNVSQSRLALYRSRMKRLNIGTIVVDERTNRIRFSVFGGGFTDTTWSIGYAWSKNTPQPLVESAYSQMPARDKMHFSRIEGHWYMYHRK